MVLTSGHLSYSPGQEPCHWAEAGVSTVQSPELPNTGEQSDLTLGTHHPRLSLNMWQVRNRQGMCSKSDTCLSVSSSRGWAAAAQWPASQRVAPSAQRAHTVGARVWRQSEMVKCNRISRGQWGAKLRRLFQSLRILNHIYHHKALHLWPFHSKAWRVHHWWK